MMRLQALLIQSSCIVWLGILLNACSAPHIFDRVGIQDKPELKAIQRPRNGNELAIATDREQQIADQIHQKVNPAVVTVYSINEMGSGMIVEPNGLILTNKHVVQHSTQVSIKTVTGKIYQGKIVDFDLRHDLALIRLNVYGVQLPTVSLVNKLEISPGDPVYALGNPDGKVGILTSGTFLRTTEHGSLQLSAGLLSPGNSGGPLLDAQGNVVGISKGLLKDNSGLATSVTHARELIGRYQLVNKQKG